MFHHQPLQEETKHSFTYKFQPGQTSFQHNSQQESAEDYLTECQTIPFTRSFQKIDHPHTQRIFIKPPSTTNPTPHSFPTQQPEKAVSQWQAASDILCWVSIFNHTQVYWAARWAPAFETQML